MDNKDITQKWQHQGESQAWRASRETQGTITILDPSIFD